MSKMAMPKLEALSCAVPQNVLLQTEAIAIADDIFGLRFDDYAKLRPVFTNAGVSKRHLAMPVDWYLGSRDWPDRTTAYIEQATTLFVQVANAAFQKATLKAHDIDAVVTVSSTGIATPSLEARAMSAIGFRPNVLRVPVFGMGCAGGISGLTLATQLAKSKPNFRVLLVVVELCSMSFRIDKLTKANVVATALFGDGAAAAVVSTNGKDGLPELGVGCQHTWPGTLDIMGWKVDPTGFEVVFDRAIPPFVRRHVRPVFDQFLLDMSVELSQLVRLTFHPGGAKVIEALEEAFGLQAGSLDHERDVLGRYGNMSAPTVLFVLQELLETRLSGQSLLTALGPGFTAASIPVKAPQ